MARLQVIHYSMHVMHVAEILSCNFMPQNANDVISNSHFRGGGLLETLSRFQESPLFWASVWEAEDGRGTILSCKNQCWEKQTCIFKSRT